MNIVHRHYVAMLDASLVSHIRMETTKARQTCVWVHHVREACFAALLLHLFPPCWPSSWAGVKHDIQIKYGNSFSHLVQQQIAAVSGR